MTKERVKRELRGAYCKNCLYMYPGIKEIDNGKYNSSWFCDLTSSYTTEDKFCNMFVEGEWFARTKTKRDANVKKFSKLLK